MCDEPGAGLHRYEFSGKNDDWEVVNHGTLNNSLLLPTQEFTGLCSHHFKETGRRPLRVAVGSVALLEMVECLRMAPAVGEAVRGRLFTLLTSVGHVDILLDRESRWGFTVLADTVDGVWPEQS